jgi:hypothetical protein
VDQELVSAHSFSYEQATGGRIVPGDANESDEPEDQRPGVAVERIVTATPADVVDPQSDSDYLAAIEALEDHLARHPEQAREQLEGRALVPGLTDLINDSEHDPAVARAVADLLTTLAEVVPDRLADDQDVLAEFATGSAPNVARQAGYRALAAAFETAKSPSPPSNAVERAAIDLKNGVLVPAALRWIAVAAAEESEPFAEPAVVDGVLTALPTEDATVAREGLFTLRAVADIDPSLLFDADAPTPVVEAVRVLVKAGEVTDEAISAAVESGSGLLERLVSVNAAPFATDEILDTVVDLATNEVVPEPVRATLLSVPRHVAEERPGAVLPYRDAVLDQYERGGAELKVTTAWVLSNLAAAYSGRVAAAAPALESELDHEAPNVRGNSAHALANIAIEDPLAVLETGAVPGLVALLTDRRSLAMNAMLALRRLVSAHPQRLADHVDRIVELGNAATDDALGLTYLEFARDAAPVYPYVARDLEDLVERHLQEAPPAMLVVSLSLLAQLAEYDSECLVPHVERFQELCRGDVSAAALGGLDDADRELEFDLLNQLPSRSYDGLIEDVRFGGVLLLREVADAEPAAMPTLDDRVLDLVDHDDAEVRAEAGRLLLETVLETPERVDNAAVRTGVDRTSDADARGLLCLALAVQSSPWVRLRTRIQIRHDDVLDTVE